MNRRPPRLDGPAWVDSLLTDEQRWGQRIMEIRARAGRLARWPEGIDLEPSNVGIEKTDQVVGY